MKIAIYRVLSFLLLPVALVFGMSVLVFIRAAIENPSLLFPLFFIACVAIYTFASFNFLIRGIDGKNKIGKSSKEWLIVNAIVSILYALMAIAQRFLLMNHPEITAEYATQFKTNLGNNSNITEEVFIRYINGVSYFLLVYGIILFTHIIISFQYIRQYIHVFQNKEA